MKVSELAKQLSPFWREDVRNMDGKRSLLPNGEIIAARNAGNTDDSITSLTTRMAYAAGDMFNVLAYGATGDGSTDDRSALQTAIDAANTAGGGIVAMPVGEYLIGDTLQLKSNTFLVGQGEKTIIKSTSTVDFSTATTLILAQDVSNVALSRLRIEDTGQNSLIQFIGSNNCRVDHCVFHQDADTHNRAAIGIYDAGDGTTVENFWIESNKITSTSHAILIQGDDGIGGGTASEIREIHIRGNTIHGDNATHNPTGIIKIDENLYDVECTGNIIDGGGQIQDGINVQQKITNCVVANNIVRNFTLSGINVDGGQEDQACTNVLIADNVISNDGTGRGVKINGVVAVAHQSLVVRGNVIRNTAHGVFEGASTTSLELIVEDNNIFEPATTGLQIRSDDVIVRRNYIKHASAPSTAAINLHSDTNDCIVLDNIINIASGTTINDLGTDNIIRHNQGASRADDIDNLAQTFIKRHNPGSTTYSGGVTVLRNLPLTTSGGIAIANWEIPGKDSAGSNVVPGVRFTSEDSTIVTLENTTTSAVTGNLTDLGEAFDGKQITQIELIATNSGGDETLDLGLWRIGGYRF